jgi:glycosyltransferase involved in cell wall biosynthesis
MPRFSVVIPTFNRGHMVAKSIDSVVRQSFEDWHLVVVDDGSTDDTREVVEEFDDSRIDYVPRPHEERSVARNTGIDSSVGEFVCFLDSDDRWHADHLDRIQDEIVRQDDRPALYFTSWRWVFPDRARNICLPSPAGRNPVEFVIENQIACSAACIHRSIGEQLKFNPGLVINEDVEYFARIASMFALIQIAAQTVDVIVHPGNTGSQVDDMITPQIEAMQIIFAHDGTGKFLSPSFRRSVMEQLHERLAERTRRSS